MNKIEISKKYLISFSLLSGLLFFIFQSCNKENQAPQCDILFPLPDTAFFSGDMIPISVGPFDADGDIKMVSFYVENKKIGSAEAFPYVVQFDSKELESGTYPFSVIVEDDGGKECSVKSEFLLKEKSQKPQALFSATPTFGNIPLKVNFTDESLQNPEQWLWEFGDGTNSTEQNPVHVYNNEGQYSVSLTVKNKFGEDVLSRGDFVSIITDTVINYQPPIAHFSSDQTIALLGSEIEFIDQTTNNPTAWIWSFGDGYTSAEQNPVYEYKTCGTFDVTLTVTNPAGTDIKTRNHYISVLKMPVAAFSADITSGIAPLEVTFVNESLWGESWVWDFGDGSTSYEENPTHVYEQEGVFNVTLTARNRVGEDVLEKNDFISLVDLCPPVTDIDGNMYSTTEIGDQCWMAENLTVTRYPNGDEIPFIDYEDDWKILLDNNTDDAYCFYDDNPDSEYGALYSYAAAIGDNWVRDNIENQGICPDGWRIPSLADWNELWVFLGGWEIAGGKLKEQGFEHWNEPNTGATDEYQFAAMPGGWRHHLYGLFYHINDRGFYWSASEENGIKAFVLSMRNDRRSIYYDSYEKSFGYSVRCIKN